MFLYVFSVKGRNPTLADAATSSAVSDDEISDNERVFIMPTGPWPDVWNKKKQKKCKMDDSVIEAEHQILGKINEQPRNPESCRTGSPTCSSGLMN